jgi:MarR family transcriptional regulator for hemolysin
MTDQPASRSLLFESSIWNATGAGQRPSLGQIGLQQFAPYLINLASQSWTTHLATALKAHDLTTTKMRALAILSIASPVTINELSLYALTEQSTMSRTLDALDEQGFVTRKARPEDLRVRDVHITEPGRAAFAQVWPEMYDLLLKLFEGVDNEEYAAFTATLHKLLANIRRHGI